MLKQVRIFVLLLVGFFSVQSTSPVPLGGLYHGRASFPSSTSGQISCLSGVTMSSVAILALASVPVGLQAMRYLVAALAPRELLPPDIDQRRAGYSLIKTILATSVVASAAFTGSVCFFC